MYSFEYKKSLALDPLNGIELKLCEFIMRQSHEDTQLAVKISAKDKKTAATAEACRASEKGKVEKSSWKCRQLADFSLMNKTVDTVATVQMKNTTKNIRNRAHTGGKVRDNIKYN